jgi:hypothetical protein
MYPKLRAHLLDRYKVRGLHITTRIEVTTDGRFEGITVLLRRDNPRFKAQIYTNWYLWDCRERCGEELPDDVICELAKEAEIIKATWTAFRVRV